MDLELIEESPVRWRIDPHDAMRVPGIVFATGELLPDIKGDQSLQQVCNVATLPGIVEASYAMPDIHWGYGFPIGGVAATDPDDGGVVSPGGVGFDISCGVRLLVSDLSLGSLRPRLGKLLDELAALVPRGAGPGGLWRLDDHDQLVGILTGGARYAVEHGHGTADDLDRCEDGGALEDADPDQVSERARSRGFRQVGSLGSGNHFLEIQQIDQIHDEATAGAFGLEPRAVVVMIHSGSRGLGHQVCTDHVKRMGAVMARYGIEVPDRQLACAPVSSPEGRAYLGAMYAAANFGRANRQLLTEGARRAFSKVFPGSELKLLYDVSHNLARLEEHDVEGRRRRLCVHRKGATPALPPGHHDLAPALASTGQPVLIPGSMGTASHVLVGREGSSAFHTACHGAGRTMSRHEAVRRVAGADVVSDLAEQGILVRGASRRGLAEEVPFAYKDVDEVVMTCELAGLATRVARLRPVGVVKG